MKSLELMRSLSCRKVIRLTLVRSINMINPKGYAKLILYASPDFVELKGYMHVGESQERLCRENMPDHKGILDFADKIYLQNGEDYKVWYGTGLFTDVSESAYIPLVYINTPPAGGGTAFDEINLLTPKKHQQFDGDGVASTYQLAETNIDSIDQVYVDGVLKTVTTDYTVNLTNGTVLPVTPANFTSGTNNIDIYWTKEN